jgi:DNA-binding MarR family transcriptional regulator
MTVTDVEQITSAEARRFRDQQRRLLRAMQAVSRSHQKRIGFGSLELHILNLIYERELRGEAMPIARDLAAVLRVDKAALSRAVATLVAAGMLVMEVHSEDGRRQSLLLTEKGRKQTRELDERAQSSNIQLLGELSDEDRRAMDQGLDAYLRLIEMALDVNAAEEAEEKKKGRNGRDSGRK